MTMNSIWYDYEPIPRSLFEVWFIYMREAEMMDRCSFNLSILKSFLILIACFYAVAALQNYLSPNSPLTRREAISKKWNPVSNRFYWPRDSRSEVIPAESAEQAGA